MSRTNTVIRLSENEFDGVRLSTDNEPWYQEASIKLYDGSRSAEIYLSLDTPDDKKESIAFVDALIVGLREMKKEMRKKKPKPSPWPSDFVEAEDE